MVKKLEEVITPAPQFTTSAEIESGMRDFLSRVEEDCNRAWELTPARGIEKAALDAASALRNGQKKASEKQTGLSIMYESPATGEKVVDKVTVAMVTVWIEKFAAFRGHFPTVEAFCNGLAKIGAKYTALLNERSMVRSDTLTGATMMLQSPTTRYEYRVEPLCARYRTRQVTEKDREFLYRHLRRNGEVIYWMGDNGAIPLPFDEKTGGLYLGDRKFWKSFTDANDEFILETLKGIEWAALAYEQDRSAGADGLPEASFDSMLLTIAPQAMLSAAYLTRRDRIERTPDGKEIRKFDSYCVSVKKSEPTLSSREAWREALARTIPQDLDFDEVAEASQFSNVPGKGLVCIPLQGDDWAIDVHGDNGKRRAEAGEPAPELPSEFRRFFFGEDGTRCIFQSDPKMSLLRLADFIYRVLYEKVDSRQCLCLAGAGKDGKTVLVHILYRVLGVEEATLDAEKLGSDSATYGVLNSPLVTLPEVKRPSEVFKSSFFKSLTGGDTMQLRKLYCMAIDWKPEHTRLLMTTNNDVYVGGDAQVSRLLPIAFQKAYDARTARDKGEIEAACTLQRVEFLQWACDYRAYFKALKTPQGDDLGLFTPDRLMIVTDADFEKLAEGKLSIYSLNDRELRQLERRAVEATGSGRFFVTYGEDAGDDEAEWYEILYHSVFEVAGNDEYLSRTELASAVMDAALLGRNGKPINPNAKHAIDALGISTTGRQTRDRAYKAFKEWLVSVGKVQIVNHGNRLLYKGIRIKKLSDAELIGGEDIDL